MNPALLGVQRPAADVREDVDGISRVIEMAASSSTIETGGLIVLRPAEVFGGPS